MFTAWTARATRRVSMQARITVERRQGMQNGDRPFVADHGEVAERVHAQAFVFVGEARLFVERLEEFLHA